MSMYEYFEAGVRGGMTFVNKHHAVKDAETELCYLDVNNLYGVPLSGKLPCRGFEWVKGEPDTLLKLCDNLPNEEADFGYVLEVDLHIPYAEHERLADLPPAPRSEKPPGSKSNKLLLTLEDKEHYIVHSALLKFYIEELRVRVLRVHRAVKFQQDYIFRNYINSNTEKRARSTTKFHKDYYKLMNNSLYGKTVKNLRKRKDVRLCNQATKFVSYVSRPLFKRAMQIDDNLSAAFMMKDTVVLDRPVYIGQAVLDISKLRMYRLQYADLEKYRIRHPEGSISILAGDTDSFFLAVKNISLANVLYPEMINDGLLDTSNYHHQSRLYNPQFENKIGLVKDESGGKADYIEWIFLRPKCYSMLCSGDIGNCHRAKGIQRRTDLTHTDYTHIYNSYNPYALDPPDTHTVTQRSIISRTHQLYTVERSKIALSIMDDKRMWIAKNDSLPYGYRGRVYTL